MFRTTRILIATITTAVGLAGTSHSVSIEPSEVTIELHDGADPRWIDFIEDDLERFTQTGLDRFSVDIHIWNATASVKSCHDHSGYFTNPDTGPRIDLCIDYSDSGLGTHLRHKLVLHELAHAWIYTHLTDTTRSEFMAQRDIDTWNDPATYHPARGTEIAANAIMYALHPDQPARNEYLCGYELVTSHPTPDNRTDPCT